MHKKMSKNGSNISMETKKEAWSKVQNKQGMQLHSINCNFIVHVHYLNIWQIVILLSMFSIYMSGLLFMAYGICQSTTLI